MSDQLNNSQNKSARKSLPNRFAAGLVMLARPAYGWLNNDQFHDAIYRLMLRRIEILSPRESLAMLLRMDDALYHLQSQSAIDFDDGVHTKVRHTRYPDFFIQRIKAESDVLDVGCGFGAVAHEIATATGANVVGMDIIQEKIDAARRMYQQTNLEFIVADVLTLESQRQFDAVVLSNVLEHLPNRCDFLRRIKDLTGAKLFLIRVPVFERDWRVPLKKELGLEWRLDHTHETEYTIESFNGEMDAAGLKIAHLEVRWGEIWSELVPDGA